MWNFILALCFAAGVSGFAYTKLGRRAGYGNSQNVWTIVGVVFVITAIVFYTLFTMFIKKQ